MRVLMTLLALAALVSTGRADEPSAKERAQRALAPKKAPCSCGASCPCTGGECGDAACPTAAKRGPLGWLVFRRAYNLAVRTNRPLLIWVGETCPVLERQWPEWVHTRVDVYNGPKGIEQGPCVIVAKPDGLGGLVRAGTITGIPRKEQVVGALNAKLNKAPAPKAPAAAPPAPVEYQNPYKQNPHWPYRPVLAPPMPFMPMPMMGGGCGRGG